MRRVRRSSCPTIELQPSARRPRRGGDVARCPAILVGVQSEIPVPADAAELTALAETALARAGQPSNDRLFLAESDRIATERSAW